VAVHVLKLNQGAGANYFEFSNGEVNDAKLLQVTARALRRLGIRIPIACLAVTFVYLRPNYKRSLELLLLNGHCFSPTCAKPNVLVAQLTLCS
jgi:hypothetical protein